MSIILDCIRTVGRGERGRKPLSFEQAYQVMREYLNGEVADDQMAMLMMLIRVQNETQQEISGFVKAFQSTMPDIGADIDWPCYAGKRVSAGKPWHLTAAFLLAHNGYRVLMHGYLDPKSEREHVENELDKFAIPVAENAEHAKALFQQGNIVYLPLKNFAPQAVAMLNWKQRYGLRTPVNTVVRALNPGKARFGVRGSFHPGFQQLHAEIEQSVGNILQGVVSFKGQSGESEYNPKVSQTVWLSGSDGVTSHYWPENRIESLPLPEGDELGTPQQQLEQMANAVIATLAAVLFTEVRDREIAQTKALEFWRNFLNDRRKHPELGVFTIS